MITLRLEPKLENKVKNIARLLGISKSELVRRSVSHYITQIKKINAWEAGKDLFGKYSSGKDNLSQDRKKILREKVVAKKR